MAPVAASLIDDGGAVPKAGDVRHDLLAAADEAAGGHAIGAPPVGGDRRTSGTLAMSDLTGRPSIDMSSSPTRRAGKGEWVQRLDEHLAVVDVHVHRKRRAERRGEGDEVVGIVQRCHVLDQLLLEVEIVRVADALKPGVSRKRSKPCVSRFHSYGA